MLYCWHDHLRTRLRWSAINLTIPRWSRQICTEIKKFDLRLGNFMGPAPPQPSGALWLQARGPLRRQFRSAKHLARLDTALAPIETIKPLTIASRIINGCRPQAFCRHLCPASPRSFRAGSGCIPSPSVAYPYIFLFRRISGRNSARHRLTIRSVTPYLALNSSMIPCGAAGDDRRPIVAFAYLLLAGKIVARNFPSVRNCKLAFSACALASAAPIANLAFCSRHDRLNRENVSAAGAQSKRRCPPSVRNRLPKPP